MAHFKKQARLKRPLFAMISSTALALVMTAAVFADGEERSTEFKIQPMTLQAALLEYSEQAGVQLILAADTRGLRLNKAIEGTMGIEAALAELIKGTDLEFHFTSENTVTIRKKAQPQPVVKTAQAQDDRIEEKDPPANRIEEIISVGTRAKGRTATETPVPVDVVTNTDLARTGQTEVGRMLQTLAPSFNFSSSSVSDGTDALRPATLRGLGPDQTLVLINGKRRHTSALVHVNTSVGRGAAGVDMNAIPGSALGRIEVLRDGSAAQYGSDAIAGVINLVLREGGDDGEVTAHYGQTFEGDGETLQLSANLGVTLGTDGFVNLTADYRDRGFTNRAGLSGVAQYSLVGDGACDATGNEGCDPREFTFDRQNFRIGDAESEQKALTVNMEYPLGDTAEFYAFATYSDRKNQSAGFYRRANQYDRTVASIYPDGFLPLINTNIEDYSVSAGIRRTLADTDLDLSITHGDNNFNFYISNSLNASLGASSPTEVDAGTLSVAETLVNIDAVRAFKFLGKEATFAFGGEYREEFYELLAGDPASYEDGGQLNYDCPGCATVPVAYQSGFQVFRGFSLVNEVDAKRHNVAFYMDLEVPVSDRWLLTGAARYEDYSDFGSRLTWKLSSRVDVSDMLSFRGSLSTGFRAPSMQQKNFNSVSTQFVDIAGTTTAQERGTFRNDSYVAQLAGVPSLKEETSFNASAGLVLMLGGATLTADYYHIEIDDRIGISGAIDLTQPGFEAVGGAASSAQFFVNAADTSTDGLDLVASYSLPMPEGQSLELGLAANWTKTEVVEGSVARSIGGVDVGPLFTAQDISIIEDWQPKSRLNLHAVYTVGAFTVNSRVSRFGSYMVCEGTCDGAGNIQDFSAKWLTDLQVSYRFETLGFTVSMGANNLFDVTPDLNEIGQARAGDILDIVSSPGVFQYSRRSAPFGFNGGYWYLRTSLEF